MVLISAFKETYLEYFVQNINILDLSMSQWCVFLTKNIKYLKIATISESCHLSNDYAKNDGLQYYWGNKGETKQIACCICYILSHGGIGNWYLKKKQNSNLN